MDKEVHLCSVRLYKNRPLHHQAYGCLMGYNKDLFKSYNDFIAEAIVSFSRHLKEEQEKTVLEDRNAYLSDKENPVFDVLRNVLREVLDGKLDELYARMKETKEESNEDNIKNVIAETDLCTDRDEKFADFYSTLE